MSPFPIIISGHQRSGTTLVQRLCDLHPDLRITAEAGLFFDLGSAFPAYRKALTRRFMQARNRSIFSPKDRWLGQGYDVVEPARTSLARAGSYLQKGFRLHQLQNYLFLRRYLGAMNGFTDQAIKPETVQAALKALYPQAIGVGDKHPDYIFQFQKLSVYKELRWLIIIRDPRDMANSVLAAYSQWGKHWGAEVGDPEKIATRWVKIINLVTEQIPNQNVLLIRYEDLVRTPLPVITEISDHLGVRISGFNLKLIHADRIGAYRTGLDPRQIAVVQEIAGPTMEQIGYSI